MDFKKNIEDFDLVFLDLETTGLDVVMGDAICEIGALKVNQRKIIDKFHSLINPRKSIPNEAYQIHKISDQDLKNAPYFEDVATKFKEFLGQSVICAYNVGFDMGFIEKHLDKMDTATLDLPSIDIFSMARNMLNLHRYNLKSTANFFSIDCSQGLHRALGDARIAHEVFYKLLDLLKAKGIQTLEELIALYGLRNEVFRSWENKRIDLFKEAISKRCELNMSYFSQGNNIEQEKILPLGIEQENNYLSLLYQGSKGEPFRISLNRILKIESIFSNQ